MGFFDLRQVSGLLLMAVAACASKTVPAFSPDRPNRPWPSAIIDSQGQPALEFVEQTDPGAIELMPRHSSAVGSRCELDGVEWELSNNHRRITSKQNQAREIFLPAYPEHGLVCNGRYLAIDATIDNSTIMWVIDSSTGHSQRMRLPALRNLYGRVFPVLDPTGELAYTIAVSYSGVILLVQGEKIEYLPGPELAIRSDVDITQRGDSLLVQTDFVYVVSASQRRLRGTLDIEDRRVWVRAAAHSSQPPPGIASVAFRRPTDSSKGNLEMVSPVALFDGDPKTESLFAQGDHIFTVLFNYPRIDPVVQVFEPESSSRARISQARVGGSFIPIPVYRQNGSSFPSEKRSEASPPNLHRISSELTISLTCDCASNTSTCEDLCHVAEIGF